MSVNKAILVGNLGRDMELRYTPGGAAVGKFSLATTEKWTDKSGEKQSKTEWHNCTLWGKQAETLAEWLKKGKQCYIEGRIETHEYEKDDVKRKSTEINVQKVVLLGGGRRDDADQREPEPAMAGQALSDDDVPF